MILSSRIRWVALCAAFVLVIGAQAPAQLMFIVINELDADTPTLPVNDELEFIELFDGGIGNQSLAGYSVVFFNGGGTNPATGTTSYFALDLTGSTDANGYYLIGNPNVVPTPVQTWPPNTLQNGPDAVGLYFGPASAFPNNTVANTTNLVDAVVYHTSDPPAPNLINILTPGQPQVDENANGNSPVESIGRCANGTGGVLTTTGWIAFIPTPGTANACPIGPAFGISITQQPACGGPIVIAVIGAQPFAELFNIISLACAAPAGSGPLFGLSVGVSSGDPLGQFLAPLGFQPFHVNADVAGTYSIAFPTSGICPGVSLSLEAVSLQVIGFSVQAISPTTGCVGVNL